MSFSLPDVNLSTAVVGTRGKILLQNMGISAGGISANPSNYKNPAMLNIRNDSGCGLAMVLKDTGGQFTLGAGEWTQQPIPPGESAIIYTVKYLLPSPPVSLLMIDYYAPGETVPQTSTLGNSPVGIGGSVQTSSVQTLSNEGNAAGGLVVDIGDITIAQLWKIWTDHFSISVDQGGTPHTVIQGKTTGNPLQLGQSGDPVEILGSLVVDGVGAGITDLGPLAVSGAVTLAAIGLLTHVFGDLTVDGATTLTGIATLTAIPSLVAKIIHDSTTNKLLDWTVIGGVHLYGNPASSGPFKYGADQTHVDVSIAAISKFSGAGSGTFAHGLTISGVGVTPDIVIPVQNVAGSETMGYSALGSTNVTITTGASQAWQAIAIKL